MSIKDEMNNKVKVDLTQEAAADTPSPEKEKLTHAQIKDQKTSLFQIEEMKDDRFRIFSQFSNQVTSALIGSNGHTKSAMKLIFLAAAGVGSVAQILRKNDKIDLYTKLQDTDDNANDKKSPAKNEKGDSPSPAAGPVLKVFGMGLGS